MENPYYVGEEYNINCESELVPNSSRPEFTIKLSNEEYTVTSFKLDGTLINGDSFVMPHHDVTITDIQTIPAYYSITNTDSDISVEERARYGSTINLVSNNYRVNSFKVNGNLVNGDSFVMPAENVTITDVQKSPQVTVESEHYPYPDRLSYVTYYENTFERANSLTVEFTYQTEGIGYDWIYLIVDPNEFIPFNNKQYGGRTKTTETLTIPSNYLKILFTSNYNSNFYYGFKAVITPNYD